MFYRYNSNGEIRWSNLSLIIAIGAGFFFGRMLGGMLGKKSYKVFH